MDHRDEYDIIRTACNVLIVLHHSSFAGMILTGGAWFPVVLLRDVAWTLPTFFLLSGYLMFCGMSLNTWRGKIVRRMKRLMIPFFVWNAIFVVCFIGIRYLVPSAASAFDGGADKTPIWFLSKIFGFSIQTGDPPLWYLRTLMLYALLAPLLLVLFRKRIMVLILLLCLLLFAIVVDSTALDGRLKILIPPYSLICFSVGAYMASCRLELHKVLSKYRIALLMVGLCGYIMRLSPVDKYCPDIIYCLQAWFWPALIMCCIGLFRRLCIKHLIKASFFVYAAHIMFRPIWAKFWCSIDSQWGQDVLAFPIVCEFFITIGMCVGLYYTLRRISPFIVSVLNGDYK